MVHSLTTVSNDNSNINQQFVTDPTTKMNHTLNVDKTDNLKNTIHNDNNNNNKMQQQQQRSKNDNDDDDITTNNTSSLLSNAIGSAAAGLISRLITHPLDTAKARLQAPTITNFPTTTTTTTSTTTMKTNISFPYQSSFDVLHRTIRTEGMKGLYRGFGTVVVGGTPGTVCYLCTYEYMKKTLSNTTTTWNQNQNRKDFFIHFTSGMIAETVACIIYVPVDVIKERLQIQHNLLPSTTIQSTMITNKSSSSTTIQSHHHYKNGLDAMKQIIQTEGIRGIYKGYGATLASFGPFSALYFTLYEQTKYMARQYLYTTTNHTILNQEDDRYEKYLLPSIPKTVDNTSTKFTQQKQQQQHPDIPSAQMLEKQIQLPFYFIVLCTCFSGAIASFVTSPLDMAKLRLQIQRRQPGGGAAENYNKVHVTSTTILKNKSSSSSPPPPYRTLVQCLQYIYIHEGGIKGLFRGAGARVLHFAPATTITMTLYETFRSYLHIE